jgi:hypothetical protein
MYVTLAGTADKICMIEAGANEVPDDVMLNAIIEGHKTIKEICAFINEIVADCGKPKFEYVSCDVPADMFADGADYDYLVVYEHSVDSETSLVTRTIISRWFILEADRTRGQQYELKLKRDVIADHYNQVIDSPIFLEKGYINDVNDPLLYNSESLNVNQIKQLEIPLKDETGCGWVVGFIPSDSFNETEPSYTRVDKTITMPMNADITVNGLSSWTYWNYCSNNAGYKFMADTTARRAVTVKIRSQYMYADSARSAKCNLVTADFTFYPNSTDAGVFDRKNSGTISNSGGS